MKPGNKQKVRTSRYLGRNRERGLIKVTVWIPASEREWLIEQAKLKREGK